MLYLAFFSAAFSLWFPLEANTGKGMEQERFHVQLGMWERAHRGEGNNFIKVKELSGGVEVYSGEGQAYLNSKK